MEVDIFEKFYAGKKVLITGGTGFKGAWLATWLVELGAEVYSYALPPITNEDGYVTSNLEKKITSKIADIRDAEELTTYFGQVQPDIAFHLAAQPIVLNSYKNPTETFDVNVMGTVHFLEAIRKTKSVKASVIVTSDKCYQNNEWIWGYRENDPMGGDDPYSASKGCTELVVNSYIKSFFSEEGTCNIASVRAGNVIGGGDWSDHRIISDFFRANKSKSKLLLRNPSAIRPWQFVLEPISGYLMLAKQLFLEGKKYSGGWNFGPLNTNYHTVLEVVSLLANYLEVQDIIQYEPFKNNSFHEAHFLKLDITKAINLLKWNPVLSFEQTIMKTLEGYQNASYDDRVNQILSYINIYKNK